MSFIQIIEFRTDDIDQLRAIDERWRQATEGKRTLRRDILTRDRDDPSRHVVIAFFDSYESAMQNSGLPETDAAAADYQALTREIGFRDLDVLDDHADNA